MRRRLRILRDLLKPQASSGPAPGGAASAQRGSEEERSAEEMKRRLEETRERLKRKAPPIAP